MRPPSPDSNPDPRLPDEGAAASRDGAGAFPESGELAEHVSFVRGVALAMVDDPDLAEDISQEAILAALRRPPRIEHDLRAWLRGAVRNLARMHYRERSRRTGREKVVAETRAASERGSDSVEEAVGRAELRQRIARSVLELDDPYRTVLVLRYMEDLSPTEIAGMDRSPPLDGEDATRARARTAPRAVRRRDGESGALAAPFLGLLLPLPVLLASAATASAASLGAASSAGSSGSGSATASGAAATSASANGTALTGVGIALRAVAALLAIAATGVVVTEGFDRLGREDRSHRFPVRSAETAGSEETDGDAATDAVDSGKTESPPTDLAPESTTDTPEVATPTTWTLRVVDPSGEPLPGTRIEPAIRGYWIVRGDGAATIQGNPVPGRARRPTPRVSPRCPSSPISPCVSRTPTTSRRRSRSPPTLRPRTRSRSTPGCS